MKCYSLVLLLFLSMLQSCSQSASQHMQPEKPTPDPKPFYGIELGMTDAAYKKNLFRIYKKGLAGYGKCIWPDSVCPFPVGDVYLNIPFSAHQKWRLRQNFFNNRLMDLTLEGYPICEDSIPLFISYLNKQAGIQLQKKSDGVYNFKSASKKSFSVVFDAYKTEITLCNSKDYITLKHLTLFGRGNIMINIYGDHWDRYHSKSFNEFLPEEIIDVIYNDLTQQEKIDADRVDFRYSN